jgi:nucleotide-binding universal stress UspA family protein
MSVPFRHIACCVDDSDAGREALAMARELRAAGAGRLSVVHAAPRPLIFVDGPHGEPVPDPRDIWSRSGRWLRRLARTGEDAVLLQGDPPIAVVDWACDAGVDLLVAAAHRSRVERALLGGFAAHLAYHAPCAVLLTRPRRPPVEGAGGG